ncbi:hypothetical protein PoB_000970300 [Plakobranchus ocellatus]|uniref:Uncharacterized protein n=1 Tax=Plakobranchus ocellatus TaxID=259542 RepID=A0AAV3YLT9_9GAST|nr:hypothetical protein PoB_000970300 [Plakobranchus ocellatus]
MRTIQSRQFSIPTPHGRGLKYKERKGKERKIHLPTNRETQSPLPIAVAGYRHSHLAENCDHAKRQRGGKKEGGRWGKLTEPDRSRRTGIVTNCYRGTNVHVRAQMHQTGKPLLSVAEQSIEYVFIGSRSTTYTVHPSGVTLGRAVLQFALFVLIVCKDCIFANGFSVNTRFLSVIPFRLAPVPAAFIYCGLEDVFEKPQDLMTGA